MRFLLAISLLAVAPLALPAQASESGQGTGTFSASTGGGPAALAVGSWQVENGNGTLDVNFASGPQPLGTTFTATWTSALRQLTASRESQRLGVLAVGDDTHNTVTPTEYALDVSYRTRKDGGEWTAWQEKYDETATFARSQAGSFRRYLFVEAVTTADCDCSYQVQYRVSGNKQGTDASRLLVTTTD